MSPYWFKLVPTVHPQYGQVHRRKPKTTPKRGRRRRRTTSDPICRCHSCHSCHSFCQVQSPELLLFNWLNRDLCDTLWPYIPLHMAFHMALHFTTLGSSGVIWGRRCDWNIVPWWPRQDPAGSREATGRKVHQQKNMPNTRLTETIDTIDTTETKGQHWYVMVRSCTLQSSFQNFTKSIRNQTDV